MSAQIEEPASPHKAALIRRFLEASGLQGRIDSGTFLDQFALGASPAIAATGATIRQSIDALKAAYRPHRKIWQEEYESHINWEFAEGELEIIVKFLESTVGQHFLEGRWRMDAYISSNTEHLTEQVIAEAVDFLSRSTPASLS